MNRLYRRGKYDSAELSFARILSGTSSNFLVVSFVQFSSNQVTTESLQSLLTDIVDYSARRLSIHTHINHPSANVAFLCSTSPLDERVNGSVSDPNGPLGCE